MLGRHKHQWRKVEAFYSNAVGLVTVKKKCITCGKVKVVASPV